MKVLLTLQSSAHTAAAALQPCLHVSSLRLGGGRLPVQTGWPHKSLLWVGVSAAIKAMPADAYY